ncbi:MAG: tetratricopeptide repeat protein [Bacteroidetes bacterium]|nr:tetratricopeptide repeat protein [Bacteroidota bacterium]
MRIFITLLFLLLAGFNGEISAQPGQSNAELANQYFSTGEFEKAVVYFEKYYDQDPFGAYNGYMQCLIKVKEYDKAEKLVKKQMKRIPQDPSLKIDLGAIYELQEEPEKAKKVYADAIKNLSPDINQVNLLGNGFTRRQQLDYTVETYLQGRKLLKGAYPFSFELAEAYAQMGKFPEMVNEYIEMIDFNPGYLPNIQTILQNKIGNDLSGNLSDLVRQSLLRKIQKRPEDTNYSELLLWLFLQEKDFESAFIQAKGLDKRLGEQGERLVSLGRTAVNNLDFPVAEKCFQYVVDKGSTNMNYVTARMELINVTNERITGSGTYTRADLLRLESDYVIALQELGKNVATAPLIRGFSHLQAFYLHNTDKAIELLLEAIDLPNLKTQFKAECKLELADIYVFDGLVWDAALLYGQVDKDFKNDALGREAKFRNARLSYYLGEFDWAKDQLNVLKAATSQLISNDALSLSLLITDITNLDTTMEALLMYSRADLYDFQNKDSLSMITLDSILTVFPGHMLSDEVWYKKAQILKPQGRFTEAAALLAEITEKYPEDILADDAMYQLGLLYENQLNDKEKAKTIYESLLTKYPGSLFVVDARKRFRLLRGDKIN